MSQVDTYRERRGSNLLLITALFLLQPDGGEPASNPHFLMLEAAESREVQNTNLVGEIHTLLSGNQLPMFVPKKQTCHHFFYFGRLIV